MALDNATQRLLSLLSQNTEPDSDEFGMWQRYASLVAGVLASGGGGGGGDVTVAGAQFVSEAGVDATAQKYSLSRPYKTLRKAISEASNGDTIVVLPGVHKDASTASIPLLLSQLSIVGLDKNSTRLELRSFLRPENPGCLLSISNVTFANFDPVLSGFVEIVKCEGTGGHWLTLNVTDADLNGAPRDGNTAPAFEPYAITGNGIDVTVRGNSNVGSIRLGKDAVDGAQSVTLWAGSNVWSLFLPDSDLTMYSGSYARDLAWITNLSLGKPNACVVHEGAVVQHASEASNLSGIRLTAPSAPVQTVTTAAFTVPGVGSGVGITVASNAWMQVGGLILIDGAGQYLVTFVGGDGVSASVSNTGSPGSASPGTLIGYPSNVRNTYGTFTFNGQCDDMSIVCATPTNNPDLTRAQIRLLSVDNQSANPLSLRAWQGTFHDVNVYDNSETTVLDVSFEGSVTGFFNPATARGSLLRDMSVINLPGGTVIPSTGAPITVPVSPTFPFLYPNLAVVAGDQSLSGSVVRCPAPTVNWNEFNVEGAATGDFTASFTILKPRTF